MNPYFDNGQGIVIYRGDCRDVLPTLGVGSIDAMVTDPPAGIGFMGKEWDDFRRLRNAADAGRDNVFGRTSAHGPQYGRKERVLFTTFLTSGLGEAYRLLKPGAHAFVWAIPRTSHWTATAVEDAGFEIRDVVTHLFGQGFPKSRNVGNGWGTALKPASEHWILARKPLAEATVAANVQCWGTGAVNVNGCRIPANDKTPAPRGRYVGSRIGPVGHRGERDGTADALGRWPANVVLDEAAAALLDEQSGERKSGGRKHAAGDVIHDNWRQMEGRFDLHRRGSEYALTATTGGASRFFYCAKASRSERGEGNDHPTVKPLALMRWLVRLITPPGGVVLDPFGGSGSTALACWQEGFGCVLVEQEEHSAEIAARRLERLVRLREGS